MIHCGFIGFGLIGGSIAQALKANRNDIYITVCDPNPDTRKLALSEKTADAATADIGPAFLDCDYIFLCAPVSCNNENLKALLPYKKKGCILTDVGSVKTPVFQTVESLGLQDCFIGGHPMAGSERIGFANAKASLLENAYYILAPASLVPAAKVEAFRQLVASLGAIPLLLDNQTHDHVTAAVSHLPHLIASSLVHLVKDSDRDGMMKTIAAGGFKDITRIASASPVMWQQICLTNTADITQLLDCYIGKLQKLRTQLACKDGDALYQFFEEARAYRESFIDAGSGPIKKAPVIRVDIPDEPGSIAAVSTLLALSGISIKNIGITHNREAEEGVLRIEFYEEASIPKAVRLLTDRGYTIHTNS